MSAVPGQALKYLAEILSREITGGDSQQLVGDLSALADEEQSLDDIASSWLEHAD